MDYKDFQLQQYQEELHFWYKARKNLIFNILNSVLKNYDKNRSILNIGCGTGTELEIIKQFGSVVALDKNQSALSEVKKLNFETMQVDIEKYELPKEYYNAICCFDCLEHLKNDQKAIDNIYQSLKPGGYFIFSVPAFQFLFSSHDIAMEHFRRYGKKEIKYKLEKSGFRVARLDYWNTLLFPVIVAIRLAKKIVYFVLPKEKKHKTEIKNSNKYLNKLLFWILNLENNKFLFNLLKPFGVSVWGIYRKKYEI